MNKVLLKVVTVFSVALTFHAYSQQFSYVSKANFEPLGNSHASFADYDNDGDLDLLLAGTNNLNQDTTILYRNDGDSSFTDMLIPFPGLEYGSSSWGDYDNDGDLDLLISGRNNNTNRITLLYQNQSGNFVLTSEAFTGVAYSHVSFHDYDHDGDLDILITGQDISNTKICKIYENQNGTFRENESISLTGVSEGFASWGDYNNDGLVDLLLTGSDNSSNRIAKLYRNNGNKTFTNISVPGLSGVTSGATAWGDYDQDGDLDILISGLDNLNNNICRIYKNNGGGSFSNVSTAGLTGLSSGTVNWGDYDNDGLLDVLCNGFDGTLPSVKVYKNNGDNTFTALTFVQAGLDNTFSGSCSFVDFDNDKDLDVFVTGYGTQGLLSRIYANTVNTANTAPTVPTNLSVETDDDKAILKWTASTDNNTSSISLSYNVWIGTSPTDMMVTSPQSSTDTGIRKIIAIGNAFTDTSYFIQNLPQGKYYWSVQAIDNSYEGSAFAPYGSFSICRKFNLGNDTIVCFKDSITLKAGTLKETVNWFNTGGSGVLAMDTINIKVEITRDDTIWANIINTDAGCSTFDTLIVKVNSAPVISAGQDYAICLFDTITLGGSPTASGALLDYTYLWSPVDRLNDSTIANPIAQPDTTTRYRVIVTSGSCKPDTAYVNITVHPLPVVEVSKDTSIGAGETVTLNATGAITYTWTPAQSLSNANVANPTANPIETTTYTVTGTDANQCKDTSTIIVFIKNQLFIPNLFSPDGNGSNDYFLIYGSGIKEIDFRIYNRNGEEVYSTKDPEELLRIGWDGTYKGEPLPAQALVWVMDGKFYDDEELKFKGSKTGTLILKR